MMEYLLIPIAAICNRWRGGGIYRFEWEDELVALNIALDAFSSPLTPFGKTKYKKLKTRSKWFARKLISGVILAVIASLLYNFTRLDSSYIQAATTGAVVLMGWYARNIIGTGMLFNAIHGWYAPKWKGIVYGTARGLLTLATTIPLAALFYFTGQNSNINSCILLSLLGLFGALQGVIYYAAGKLSKNHAVTVAELIDGALYGGVLCLMI